GTGALRLFLAVLKEKQICRGVTAYVNAENTAMIRILEKNGFRANRKFRAEVLDTSNGTYAVKAVSGIEYIRF
ncbi:MAG: GNAT family N-acetyltransferase, partial [Solobacterium sp.]|nr:GNAT family N-acetyltransferase [Solobacterium sp.]